MAAAAEGWSPKPPTDCTAGAAAADATRAPAADPAVDAQMAEEAGGSAPPPAAEVRMSTAVAADPGAENEPNVR